MRDPFQPIIFNTTDVTHRFSDAVVLGAGVSGLAAAYDLVQAGLSVIVIESGQSCGGMHRSQNIGNFTFDSGSVFFEDTHPFLNMFPEIASSFLPVFRRQARITPEGSVLHYPFDFNEVMSWPLRTRLRIARDIAGQRLFNNVPEDAEAFSCRRIGQTAYEASGLKNYISRFHQEDPSRIDVMFASRRMNFLQKETRLRSIARTLLRRMAGRSPLARPRRQLLVRPREGFEVMYGEIRRQLEARGVRFMLDSKVTKISRPTNRFQIETPTGVVTAAHVVSAIPLDTLHQTVFGEGTSLESLDLMTLFIRASDIPGFDGNVLFNFHDRGRWKRATIYSRIYGRADDSEYFAVEITRRKSDTMDAQAAFEEFRQDVAGMGVFSDDLTLVGSDIIEDAYPLYHKGCATELNEAMSRLTDFGIVPVGRQGRFAYLPVSAGVISKTRSELEAANLAGTREIAFPEIPDIDSQSPQSFPIMVKSDSRNYGK